MRQLPPSDPSRPSTKPEWWVLYLIAVLMVGADGLLEYVLPPAPARTVFECVGVILGFALMLVWRRFEIPSSRTSRH